MVDLYIGLPMSLFSQLEVTLTASHLFFACGVGQELYMLTGVVGTSM